MTKEKDVGKVVIVEDSANYARSLAELFKAWGLESIIFLSLPSIMKFLNEQAKKPEEKREAVAAFVVDGNLSKLARGGADGVKVIRKIRESGVLASSLIVGNTSGADLEGADYNLGKDGRGMDELIAMIKGEKG